MRIYIRDTSGKPLKTASVVLIDSQKKPLSLKYNEEVFAYVVEAPEPGQYEIRVACEGFEAEGRTIQLPDTEGVHITLGQVGCRFTYFDGGRYPVENTNEKLRLIKISDKTGTKQQQLPLLKWLKAGREESQPLLSGPVVLDIPTDESECQRLKEDIEKSGYAVFGLSLNLAPEQEITITDSLWIHFKAHTPAERIQQILDENDLVSQRRVKGTLPRQRKITAYYKKLLSWDYIEVFNRLYEYPEIAFFSPHHVIPAEDVQHQPADELFPLQWNLHLARVPEAWGLLRQHNPDITYGSADVFVNVYDTGIASNTMAGLQAIHPDFNVNVQGSTLLGMDGQPLPNQKIYNIYDFRTQNPAGVQILMVAHNNLPRHEHGSNVAGILAAAGAPDPGLPTNGVVGNQGVVGVAPNVRLMSSIWDANMTRPEWYGAWLYLSGLNASWRNIMRPPAQGGGIPYLAGVGGQLFPNAFNTPQNPGPGFYISNHSHSFRWITAAPSLNPSFLAGSTEGIMINSIVSFGRARRGAFIMFASGNDDQNISQWTTIAQHEKIIVVAGSSIGPKGFEERTSYSNFGSIVPAAGFNGPAEYAEIDFCAPTNHHSAGGNNLVNGSHFYQFPSVNRGIFTADLLGRPGVNDTVAAPGGAANNLTLPVVNGALFNPGDPILIGNIRATREFNVVNMVGGIGGNTLILNNPLLNSYAPGQRVEGQPGVIDKVAAPGATAGSFNLPVVNGAQFNSTDPVWIGNITAIREFNVINNVVGNILNLSKPLQIGYAAGQRVEVSSAANTPYSNNANTSLNGPVVAGARIIVINNAAGFANGMAVLIGNKPVYPAANKCETGFIELLTGNTITLRDPLRYPHPDGEPIFAGAANMTDAFSGTSAACPFASGVLALVLSANPNLSFWEARDLLKRNAVPIDLRLQPAPGVPPQPPPGTGLNVSWVDSNGNPVVDANGLLTTFTGINSIQSINHLTASNRTELTLSNGLAGFIEGQAIIIGAESTVVNFISPTEIQVVDATDFNIGEQVEINSSPLTHSANGSDILMVGNVNGFQLNHRIEIEGEQYTIAGFTDEPTALGNTQDTESLFILFTNDTLAVGAASGNPSITVNNGPQFTVNKWILIGNVGGTQELAQIINIAGNVLTLASPLQNGPYGIGTRVITILSLRFSFLSQQPLVGGNSVTVVDGGQFNLNEIIQLRGAIMQTGVIIGISGNVLTLNINIANVHNIGDPVIVLLRARNQPVRLANAVTKTISDINYGTNTLTISNAITPANYPIAAGIPPIIVRVVNTELAVIKSIHQPSNTITTRRLVKNHVVGTSVRGGRIPHYSYALGSGRLDAYASVEEALNYDHDARDLIIRNFMGDNGIAATDTAVHEIDSPDIWVINQPAVISNVGVGHGATNTPANAQTSGAPLHQKPLRSEANVDFYARIVNRGTLISFDYSVHIYLALKDVDIPDTLLIDDYIDGPTTVIPYSYMPYGTITDPFIGVNLAFNLNNTGNGVHPGSRLVADFNSFPARHGGVNAGTFLPLINGGDGHIYIGNLAQADRPHLPYSYVVVRTTAPLAVGNTTLPLEHTRGLSNGQQILIGRPSDTDYTVATINATPGIASVTIATPLAHAYPLHTLIIRLENVQTTLTAAAPVAAASAKFSVLEVASVADFKIGNHILSGVPGVATNRIHQIVRIVRNTTPVVNELIIRPPLVTAIANGTQLTQIGGRIKTFVLAEVTPHDGVLAGKKPEDNNNISYKEINFAHDVLFRNLTDTADLATDIQLTSTSAGLSIDFRIYVRDLDGFDTEDIVITITRKLLNGNFDSVTFYYQNTGTVGWKTAPAAPTWVSFNDPIDPLTNLAASGNLTAIFVEGDFQVTSADDTVQITVNVPGNDPMGADFITTETYRAKVSIANTPTVTPLEIQEGTGTQVLAGTQRIHAFANMTNLEQTQSQAFGIVDGNRFRLTSTFTTTANLGVDVNAYAVLDGFVFVQHNTADDTINLVLRPLRQAEIGFTRVKYFIYRGLRKEDFMDAGDPTKVRADTAAPKGNFIDSMHKVQNDRAPGEDLMMTALGWNPGGQNAKDFLDTYFFSTNPDQQLPFVKRGMTIGRYKNDAATDEFGFEIVLAEGNQLITLDNIRAKEFILDVSGISNPDEKRWKREKILHYIDPAAYYGMHFYSKIEYPDLNNADPNLIKTDSLDGNSNYATVVSKFFTRNRLYVDIRNENGYSYNFYENYTITDGGPEDGNSIRTNNKPPDQAPLNSGKYRTQDWPLLIVDHAGNPIISDSDFNNYYLQLQRADNGDPIIYLEYGFALTGTTNNSNYFIKGVELQNQSVVDAISPVTNVITVRDNLTAVLQAGDRVHLTGCEDKASNKAYILTAVAANGANAAFTDLTVQASTIAAAANAGMLGSIAYGDWIKTIGLSYPNQVDPNDANRRVDMAYVLKMRYCRHVNPLVTDVIGVNQGTPSFTLRGDVTAFISDGQSILIRNSGLVAGVANNNSYIVANGGVSLVGGDTQVQVVEPIPNAYGGGAIDGEAVIFPQKVPNYARYTDNVFGPLSSLVRTLPITNITVLSAVSSKLTISGHYESLVNQNTSLAIVRSQNNNGRYTISVVQLTGANTEITIDTSTALNTSVDGEVSLLYSIWDSDKKTKWLTGFSHRFLDMSNDPLLDATHALRNFSYLGQTGIAIENDRAIFFLSPNDFFIPPSDDTALEVLNMNGGTSDKESFWATMQFQNQRLQLNVTLLRVDPGGGEILLPVFDFEDDPADGASDIKKENFLALCLTKAEIITLTDVAQSQLKEYHEIYFVLRNEQELTDLNGEPYRRYEVGVSGHAYNANGDLIAQEAAPAAPIYTYALEDDRVVFTSEDFANLEVLTDAKENFEEMLRNQQEALDILANNPTLQTIVDDFATDIDMIDRDISAIRSLVETRGELLWEKAVLEADSGGAAPYDDRPLYWARLHMQAAIRRHPYLKKQRRRVRKMIELLGAFSRGWKTVDFSPGATATYKVLILGFDPFQLSTAVDPKYNIRQSNPSGATVVHLHGKTLQNAISGDTAYLQTVIFPVRFKDFNDGIVETFIQPFLDGTTPVDLIISVSQDLEEYFNIDRFASKFRNPESADNVNRKGGKAKFYTVKKGEIKKISHRNLLEFYETTLPFTHMIQPLGTLDNDTVVYDQGYNTTNDTDHALPSGKGSGLVPIAGPLTGTKATKGSGGNYLSNEIFYRISHIRDILDPARKTGHLHTPKLQQTNADDFDQTDTADLVNKIKTIIEDALDGL